jgi:hypothetical protein
MHACELAELSSLIAMNGARFVRGHGRLSESGLRQYWTAAKRRFEQWMRAFRQDEKQTATAAADPAKRVSRMSPLLDEIFTSELLTRVWTVLVCQYDRHTGHPGAVPMIWSVMQTHLDARHRALRLLCAVPEDERPVWAGVDRLRRRSEHWNDLLLTHLVPHGAAEADRLAFDVPRLHEFAQDLADLRRTPHGDRGWQLFQVSIKAAFASRTPVSPNAEWNAQIAASIVACFPPEFFEATGALRSLWQERLRHTTADTLAMLDDLLQTADR